MRAAHLILLTIVASLAAGYLLWGPDPQTTEAAVGGMEEAREAATVLEAQGADATTCAAKLERHFQLTAEQTAEILCEMSYDAAANAEALREVYGLRDYPYFVAQLLHDGGCSDWCDSIDPSLDADDLLHDDCRADRPPPPDVEGYRCDPAFLFEVQTQCFGLVDLQAEDWLRGNGFEDGEYLSTTARPYVEKFAPVLMFDQDAITFPMDAQKWFDQELCGAYGGPKVTRFPGGQLNVAEGSQTYCSQVANQDPQGACSDTEPCNSHPWMCTTNDVQHLRKGECSINGVHTGTPCLRHEDCGSGGCALAICAYPGDPNRSFPDDPERMRYSTLPDYRIPTYYQVRRCGSPTDVPCDGTSYCSTGQLRIKYWWYYGYQEDCDTCSGEHRADWEGVVVTTSNDRRRIAAVTYSQHHGWYTKVHSTRRHPDDWFSFLNLAEHAQCYADGEPCQVDADCDPHWQPGGAPQVCEYPDSRTRADGHPVVYAGKEQHGSYHDSGGNGLCYYYQDHRNPKYDGNPRDSIDYPATGWATWESPLINLDGDEQGWIKHSAGRCRAEDHTRPPTGDPFADPTKRPLVPENVTWYPSEIAEQHKGGFPWGHDGIGTQPPRWGEEEACTLASCGGTKACWKANSQPGTYGCCKVNWARGPLPLDSEGMIPVPASLQDERPYNAPSCTGQCIGGDRDGKLCEASVDCPGGDCRGYACCQQRPYENLDASDPWSSCKP